jgi:regulatory protein
MSSATRRDEPEPDLADGPDADPVEVAKHIVLTQLTASPKSRHQLEQVLARRSVPPAAAREALDRFTELGYIDDSAFARSWVESRQRSRGLSASALRRELRSKGIDAETADQVIGETVTADGELAAAARLVDKKLRSMRGVDDDTATRRLVGMLGRKGYRPSVAFTVVRQALAQRDSDALRDGAPAQ